MLAADIGDDLTKVQFPCLVQPKLDGIRAIVKDDVVWSRSGKPLPNKALQELYGTRTYSRLDGEFLVGDPTDKTSWNQTSTVVMSEDKPIDGLKFYVFDGVPKSGEESKPFEERYRALARFANSDVAPMLPNLVVVPTTQVNNLAELLAAEDFYVEKGYEGLIIRSPNMPYKHGRSTVNQQHLLKLKRFQDAEGTIVDMGERMHNGNPAEKDAFGRTKRSSAKAGKTGRGDLGFLLVEHNGVQFEVGTGFDDALRAKLWNKGVDLIGETITFKFQKYSPNGVPIFPVFKGFRNKLDL